MRSHAQYIRSFHTCLAINLAALNLSDNDEFIFTIKNYDYADSSYIFLFKARNTDINPKTGEVIFKVPASTAKMLKHGAFYNFTVLTNAYDRKSATIYKRLTENGKILIEYGAQDMLAKTGLTEESTDEIISARLAPLDTVVESIDNPQVDEILKGQLKVIEEV